MFKHRKTGVIFNNRKDAIIIMGQKRYCRFLENGEFEFYDTNTDIRRPGDLLSSYCEVFDTKNRVTCELTEKEQEIKVEKQKMPPLF